MKKLILAIAIFTFSGSINAAEKKKSSRTRGNSVVISESHEHEHDQGPASDNNLTVELGFKQSALHFGVTFVKEMDPVDFGGYFFFQTDKKYNEFPRVNQVISFGGISKFYAMKTAKANAYIAPGFGIHMVKDVVDVVVDTTKKSDKTAFGPILKIGGTLALTPTLDMGLEYTQISNWFEESIPEYYSSYTSAVISFSF